MSSPSDTKPTEQIESTQSAADQAPKSICGVCEKAAPKYKCPRCFLPYCSVACNKVHRENHPPDPEPKPEPPQAPAPEAPPPTTATSASDKSNPFRVLDLASEQLQLLFTRYPNLPQQLVDIHAAMQPPSESADHNGIPASLLKGLPGKKERWNHDVGIKKGKEALRKARKADGALGEGVKEYCELIMHLMNGQAGDDASVLLQKQAATQDAELIERLMNEENKR
ncbi:Zinc finger, HIT-type [Cordyceps fumosorosea ARSEF 2679]|uniref:Zinc finger, HIT-type n=1 Tax=Cordyceps fumosorosea (strain ARSEF 2679) TaxID=1081104 RepID=A0A167TIG0_CORFA|nr:Zinc finger, HIT-type [Cordyceps fumosorosea ARSEF 2679]OAA60631.1 Zinc finger, HIT-type [Cordyceps fumosorosea ARSEF 2679]